MASIKERLVKFIAQPSTRTGLIAIGGVVIGAADAYFQHKTGLAVAVGTVAFGIAKIIEPDNSVLDTEIEALVTAGVQAELAKRPATVTNIINKG